MANGIEDLIEKNKDKKKPVKNSTYRHWAENFGEEDAQMLAEKSYTGKPSRERDAWDD